MARIYSDTRYELLAKPTPAEAMTSLNADVCSSGLGHRFITLAIVVLDPNGHTLTVVNAGHLPPLLRSPRNRSSRSGTDVSGLAPGHSARNGIPAGAVTIAAGESVVLATDGVTEAMNASHRNLQHGPADGVSQDGPVPSRRPGRSHRRRCRDLLCGNPSATTSA